MTIFNDNEQFTIAFADKILIIRLENHFNQSINLLHNAVLISLIHISEAMVNVDDYFMIANVFNAFNEFSIIIITWITIGIRLMFRQFLRQLVVYFVISIICLNRG